MNYLLVKPLLTAYLKIVKVTQNIRQHMGLKNKKWEFAQNRFLTFILLKSSSSRLQKSVARASECLWALKNPKVQKMGDFYQINFSEFKTPVKKTWKKFYLVAK